MLNIVSSSAPGEGHWYEYYRQEDVPYFATDMDLERVIRWLRSADYYNNDRGQWELLKLTPNEYYEYCITGIYPLISYNQSEKGNCPQEK